MPELILDFDQEIVRKRINEEIEKYTRKEQKEIKEEIYASGIGYQYLANMLQKGSSQQDFSLPAIILIAKALKKPAEFFLFGQNYFVEMDKENFIRIPYILPYTDDNDHLLYIKDKNLCVLRYDKAFELTNDPLKLVLFIINNDTMEPVFRSGSELLIDCSRRNMTDGDIFAFNTSNFKSIRIHQFRLELDRLRMISFNKKYNHYWARPNDINMIGQVIGYNRILVK